MAAILLLPWILEKEIAVEEDDPGRFLPLSLQDKSKDLRLKPVLDSKKLGQIKEDRVPFFLKAVGIVLQRKIFLGNRKDKIRCLFLLRLLYPDMV